MSVPGGQGKATVTPPLIQLVHVGALHARNEEAPAHESNMVFDPSTALRAGPAFSPAPPPACKQPDPQDNGRRFAGSGVDTDPLEAELQIGFGSRLMTCSLRYTVEWSSPNPDYS